MDRATFLASGTVASTTLAFAEPVPGGSQLVERASAFDAPAFDRLVGRRAQLRQVWDNAAFKPAVLNNIKNALNGLIFGFGYAPESLTLALVNHSGSAAYTYDDSIWAKYRIGDFLQRQGASVEGLKKNVFYPSASHAQPNSDPNDEQGFYQDISIETLQRRGVILLTCHTAVEEQARALVRQGHVPTGISPFEVADDILMHLIPGAIVVPSGVATIAVLQQRYNYRYITVQS